MGRDVEYCLWRCRCGHLNSPVFDDCSRCRTPWTELVDDAGTVAVVYMTKDGREREARRPVRRETGDDV